MYDDRCNNWKFHHLNEIFGEISLKYFVVLNMDNSWRAFIIGRVLNDSHKHQTKKSLPDLKRVVTIMEQVIV